MSYANFVWKQGEGEGTFYTGGGDFTLMQIVWGDNNTISTETEGAV